MIQIQQLFGITIIFAFTIISVTFVSQIFGGLQAHFWQIMLQKIIKKTSINTKCPYKVTDIKSGLHRGRSRSRQQQNNGDSHTPSYSQTSDNCGSSSSPLVALNLIKKYREPKHFTFYEGQWINGYRILRHLNDGTFGRVLEVVDENDDHFAIKIVKAVERYIDSAKTEVAIIQSINQKQIDTNSYDRFVQIKASFYYGKNFCIVFEKLKINLCEELRVNYQNGFPLWEVKFYLKQILEALKFIHNTMKLIHTDLKPDNIMLTNDGDIKLIDFGGTTCYNDTCLHLINTRQYRAPEIILGCGRWSFPSDIWSLGCVAIEFYSGKVFFQTNGDDFEHLWLIENQCGLIPDSMSFNGCIKSHQWRQYKSGRLQDLNTIIDSKHFQFKDLVQKMLKVDPRQRISARNALLHPFFI